ncbi:MAG: YggS family pyridoxal phosphate-dependent enzyme [Acidobacteriaceae bacterium]
MSSLAHPTETFATRLARVEDAIAAACRHAGRPREAVRLMAVSKTHPATAIAEAVAAGITLFGENRVQEFQRKSEDLAALGIRNAEVHLIGHLQSNKSAKAKEIFSAVDTLDSLPLARRLETATAAIQKTLPVLVEIKLSKEDAKTGLRPESDSLRELLQHLPDMPHLKMRGLMTIAPFTSDEAVTRACFRKLRDLRDKLAAVHPRLDFSELSMGMSGDFAIAIEEGSTCVRIGTALFGAREARP